MQLYELQTVVRLHYSIALVPKNQEEITEKWASDVISSDVCGSKSTLPEGGGWLFPNNKFCWFWITPIPEFFLFCRISKKNKIIWFINFIKNGVQDCIINLQVVITALWSAEVGIGLEFLIRIQSVIRKFLFKVFCQFWNVMGHFWRMSKLSGLL